MNTSDNSVVPYSERTTRQNHCMTYSTNMLTQFIAYEKNQKIAVHLHL